MLVLNLDRNRNNALARKRVSGIQRGFRGKLLRKFSPKTMPIPKEPSKRLFV
jgi:hypothetical protein